MATPVKRYYPALADLFSLSDIPNSLDFVKTALTNVLSKMYYKDLQVSKAPLGDSAFYSLKIVSNDRIDFEIPGTGVFLVINPDADSSLISSFPITLEYQWKILGIIKSFDGASFTEGLDEFFSLAQEVLKLSESSLVAHAVNNFAKPTATSSNTPIQQLVDDVNGKYTSANVPYPTGSSPIIEVTDSIATNTGVDASSAIFNTYVLDGSSTDETWKNLRAFFNMLLPSDIETYLKDLIIPKVSTTLELSAALEVPRSWLLPVDPTTLEPLPEATDAGGEPTGMPRAQFSFAEATILFDSQKGLNFETEFALSTTKPVMLGNSGMVMDVQELKLDLSDDKNIAEADLDDRPPSFKGFFVKSVDIILPKEWKLTNGNASPGIFGKDILVGSEGGLSGTIGMAGFGGGSLLEYEVLGTVITLKSFSLTFKKNVVTHSDISGTVLLDQIQDSAGNAVILDVKVEFGLDGYAVEFLEPEGIPIRIKGLFTITLYKLRFGKQNGNFFMEVKVNGQREFSIPFVDKVLPISVLVDTLKFEKTDAGNITSANVKPKWESDSGVIVDFTDNGVKARIPVNKEFFKILKVNHLDIGVETITDGIDADLLFNGSLKVGPLVATAGGLGLSTNIVKTDSKGNIGPFDVSAAFVPPSEIGLSVKTKAVTGGGYLWLDPDSGNYSGAIELSFKDKFDLKAIGILSTKLPDGQDGFSLLIIVTAKFSPVQLGFGFTLSGVGGLLGLHRSVNKEELKLGVRDNKLDNILFPENVVENASTIISQMQTVFPIRKDQFVIGPMGLIGWGAPVSLIDAEIGVIIEVPNPVMIAIVGVVKIALPDKDAPIALLQINFAGIIDFENKMFSFDASLYQSRILTFALTGDMALRIKWGDKPDFGFAIGGFHPDYEAPTALGFPEMRRLTLSLFDTALLRVNLETYFAVTSNTVQTGAKLDAFAGSGEFYAEAILYYDVLLQFNPFRLTADIGAMVGIKMGKKTILTASLDVHLEGPKPWYIEGEVEFTFLAINYSIDFKETIGEEQQTKQVASIDAWTKLKDALEHKSNWQAIQPPANHQLVSLKDEGKEASALMVHPFGTLAFKQSVLPFDLELEKFGNGKPKDYKKYKIDSVEDGASNTYTTSDELEFFAPAEYLKMSDDDKLGRDSFQQFKGGAQLSGTSDRSTDHYARKPIAYEKKVIDEPDTYNQWEMPEEAFDLEILLASASISSASTSQWGKPSDAPATLALEQATYKVKHIDDLSDFTPTEFENEWAAMQYIQQQEIANPALEQTLTVLSTIELD